MPSPEELVDIWREHHAANRVITLRHGRLGVCELPSRQPTAVLSLDLCEVLRETGLSLTRLDGDIGDSAMHDYNMFYGDGVLGDDPQRARELLLPELMHYEQVPPVPYSGAITAFMARWREHGVYIIANTSTLPKCELSTIRFLSQRYPDTVHGILLPRNHDGNGTTTKADILLQAKHTINEVTGFNLNDIPTVAIEDAYHHAVDYTEHPSNTHVYMPAYSWNSPLEDHENVTRVEQQFGTLDTFIAVDEYLQACGIVK